MDRESISDLVHRLNDVELAVLLCLVADGHCILTSEENWLARLAADVEGIIGSVFGLAATTVNVTDETTLDEFVTGLLVAEARSPMLSPLAYDVCYHYSRFYGRDTDKWDGISFLVPQARYNEECFGCIR